jgi:hypothetical protein
MYDLIIRVKPLALAVLARPHLAEKELRAKRRRRKKPDTQASGLRSCTLLLIGILPQTGVPKQDRVM